VLPLLFLAMLFFWLLLLLLLLMLLFYCPLVLLSVAAAFVAVAVGCVDYIDDCGFVFVFVARCHTAAASTSCRCFSACFSA